jgi:hypothetical protein
MSIWTWIVIAAFSAIGFSLLVGLTTARMLGSISHRISDLLDAEAETWVFAAPLAREIEERSGDHTGGRWIASG